MSVSLRRLLFVDDLAVPNILRIATTYLQTYRRHFTSRTELVAFQEKQVQRLLNDVLPRSPFYRRQFHGFSQAQWRQAPLIDKQIMMTNFDQLNTLGLNKETCLQVALQAEQNRDFSPTVKGVTVGLSSGTSGSRGLFVVSPAEQDRWVGVILAKVLGRAIWQRERVAFFLRANSNLYQAVGSRRVHVAYFDLLDPPAKHLVRLAELQPTLLVGPPSLLRLLAEAQAAGRLAISPRKVISVAEVLDPLDEALIGRQFGEPVHQIYQATEGFLGSTCPYGTLHLAEDVVVVQREYLDRAKRRFVPLITDFNRTTQPIIRYRLDDILTERTIPCPCGSVLTALTRIEGRCDDLFYLPSHSSSAYVPIFPDFVRRTIIGSSSAIEAYIARQLAPDLIEIAVQVDPVQRGAAQTAVTTAFERLCRRMDCRMPRLQFTTDLPQPGPVKLRRVVQDCAALKQTSFPGWS